MSVCAVCSVCFVRVVCVLCCVVCVGLYVCLCVLSVRMSVHSALYTCQVVQQTGLKVNVNWLCR
jgi:hypothetical protein